MIPSPDLPRLRDSDQGEGQPETRAVVLRRYAGVRVLVLGAAGFIGRWVARLLTEAGADLWLTGRSDIPLDLLAAHQINGHAVQVDLADRTTRMRLLTQVRPAIIFCLAGYGVDRAERDEGLAYRINAELVEDLCVGLANLSDQGWPHQRLVHTGSALEYGRISGSLAEDSLPAPDTLYGRSKLAGTAALTSASQQSGLRALVARLFTVYGPGEHDGRLLPTLLHAAQTGKPAQLTNGAQRRDFTYVEDVAEGLLRLGLAHTGPGEIVNLATGRLTSVRDFALEAAAVLGLPAAQLDFGVLPARSEEMQHDPVTLERLVQHTRWRPTTTITQGVRETSRFLRIGPYRRAM